MIQVIERFHSLLEYVAEEPERFYSLSELAQRLEVSSSTCANIVKTMVALGYLRQSPERKGYLLGYTPFYITRHGAYRQHVGMVARPMIEKLAHDLDEMVVLVTECAGRRVELLRAEGDAPIQVRTTEIQGEFSLWTTVTGVVILAHYLPERCRYYWDHYATERNIIHCRDFNEAETALQRLRSLKCYVCDDGTDKHYDLNHAFISLASPVFENGHITAAVGMKIPAYRFTGAHQERIVAGCQAAAEAISAQLSGISGGREDHRVA